MRNQRRWSKVLLSVLALVTICAGQLVPMAALNISAQTPAPVTPSQTPLPDIGVLRVGYIPIISFAPLYVAIDKGYFEEQGLTVELVGARSGSTMIAFLSTGELDVGGGETGTALFNAVGLGLDVKVVASLSSQPPGHGSVPLLVRKDFFDSGEITKPADLEDRLVALNVERGVAEYLLSEALAQANLTVDDVTLVPLPFPDVPAAFANKAVDAAILPHPLAAKAIQDGSAAVLIAGDEIVDNPQNGVLYFGQRLLDPSNREVGVRFLVAYLRAARELYGDGWRSESNVASISHYTNIPAVAIQKSVPFYCDPNGEINEASTEKIQNYLVGRGYTELSEPFPIQRVITDTFLIEAVERLGRFEQVAPDSDDSQD